MTDRAKALFKLFAEAQVAELRTRYRAEPEFKRSFDAMLLRELGVFVVDATPARTLRHTYQDDTKH